MAGPEWVPPERCDFCGTSPPAVFEHAVAGPLALGARAACAQCATVRGAAPQGGDPLAGAGPVDFGVLRDSLGAAVGAGLGAEVALVAPAVRALAARHGQVLPIDIAAMLETLTDRHGSA